MNHFFHNEGKQNRRLHGTDVWGSPFTMVDGELTLKLNDETVRRLREEAEALKAVLSRAALADIGRLNAWLEEKNPGAARLATAATIDSLDHLPERGFEVANGVRQLRVPFGKRGYVVRYKVRQNRVLITRIFHALEDR